MGLMARAPPVGRPRSPAAIVSSSMRSARSLPAEEATCPHSPISMPRRSLLFMRFSTGRARLRAPTQIASARTGPVVASGGAPGGLEIPEVEPRPSPLGGPAYPAGVEAPANRYYTDWGLYPNQPYVIGPPWSAIVAYDLNSGTIKWRVPLGEDARAAEEGAKNTGVFMAERHGIIVTSTGLLFVATTDGKVRAHDEETGKDSLDRNAACGLGRRARDVRGERAPVSRGARFVENQLRRGSPASGRAQRRIPLSALRSYVAFALPRK